MADKTGSRVKKIGWLCPYVPIELVSATGLEPVRLSANPPDIQHVESILGTRACARLKRLLEAGLTYQMEELAGVVLTNSCDGMRRVHDAWQTHVRTPPATLLNVPRRTDRAAVAYFRHQLDGLAEWLGNISGITPTRESIRHASLVRNEIRSEMRSLFDRQKQGVVGMRGSALVGACLDESARPDNRCRPRQDDIGVRAGDAGLPAKDGPRILVTGGRLEETDVVEMLEGAGAQVVAFDNCLGLMHFETDIQEARDPIEALARQTLQRPPCPRMEGLETRARRLEELVLESSADGVVFHSTKHCDYCLLDAPFMERRMRKMREPFLVLDVDPLSADRGRLQTRLEAFVEMVDQKHP